MIIEFASGVSNLAWRVSQSQNGGAIFARTKWSPMFGSVVFDYQWCILIVMSVKSSFYNEYNIKNNEKPVFWAQRSFQNHHQTFHDRCPEKNRTSPEKIGPLVHPDMSGKYQTSPNLLTTQLSPSGFTGLRPNWIEGQRTKSGSAGKSESLGPENRVSKWRRQKSDIYSQNDHFGLVYDMAYQFFDMEAKNYKFGMFCQQFDPSEAPGDANIRPRNASRIHACHLFKP